VNGGQVLPDQRAQGFTLAVQTAFASLEDMLYYDTECEAHKALKKVSGPVKEGLMTVFWETEVAKL
jgi:hypothetical protein